MDSEIQPETDKDQAREEPARPANEGARPSGPREESRDARPPRRGRFRRRVCFMCAEKMSFLDYKDAGLLRRFVSDRGRIEGRRKAGTCAKHQRALSQAIKRARHLALLPYSPEHVRISGVGRSR